jgi:uncharacterized membrane protein YhfC
MYGIGHGGLESIAIGGVAAALLSLLAVANSGPEGDHVATARPY